MRAACTYLFLFLTQLGSPSIPSCFAFLPLCSNNQIVVRKAALSLSSRNTAGKTTVPDDATPPTEDGNANDATTTTTTTTTPPKAASRRKRSRSSKTNKAKNNLQPTIGSKTTTTTTATSAEIVDSTRSAESAKVETASTHDEVLQIKHELKELRREIQSFMKDLPTARRSSSSASVEQNDDFVLVNRNKTEPSQDAIKLIAMPETMDSSQGATMPAPNTSADAIPDAPPPETEATNNISSEIQMTEEDGPVKDDDKPEATLLDVYEAMYQLNSNVSTCVGGVATQLPAHPGLVVEGVGLIPLPITEETAEKLKAVARQAPCGRGMETVVDTSVRNTLEVDTEKVGIRNKKWYDAICQLSKEVATALGVDDKVYPDFYKLLLYEEGSFFKKHRDTEKEEGMFATLVVQLPSFFEGGSFVVTHNKKTRIFRQDNFHTAPFQCHYVAHYADCEHEILPVLSGYRLVMIYSLCLGAGKIPGPPPSDLSKNSWVSVMNRLNLSRAMFVIPLEHQYTQLSLTKLGGNALKGADRKLSKMILPGSSDRWKLYIMKAGRTDHLHSVLYETFEYFYEGQPDIQEVFHIDGSDAHKEWRWIEPKLDLWSVVKNGMILASEDLCEVIWSDRDSYHVEWSGNEGPALETIYSTYMLVVVSKLYLEEKLLGRPI